jgi:hypothetical protein
VDSQLVRVWIVDRDELNAGVHQCRDKGEVAGQTIQLGNDKLGFVFLASCERPFQFWPVVVLAAFDLRELSDQGPTTSVQVIQDSVSLCVEAEPGPALPVRADAEVCDELAVMRCHGGPK